MSSISNFIQSEHLFALLITVIVFLITLLLAVKRWISFPVTLSLLVLALVIGLIINHKEDLEHYFTFSVSQPVEAKHSKESFHEHILQGMEGLKAEVETGKENLHRIINQVQEVFDSMDIQKQKLQNFIEELRKEFEKNYPSNSLSSPSEIPSHKE